MHVYGFDLAGPSHPEATAGVCFEAEGEELVYRAHALGWTDRDILEAVRERISEGRGAVGLDAPLSYQPGGGDRPADRELRAALSDAGGESSSVMPPTMTKMAYLTLRGMTVARLLGRLERVDIAETHPASAMMLRGAPATEVRELKERRGARVALLAWMRDQGLRGLPDELAESDHLVAACAAALAVWRWQCGEPAWRYEADPPHHPHPVVC